jgi:hypothetical protein
MKIRIDDFPTGIRPIPNRKNVYYPLLERIDSFGEKFILGIVPAICSEQDWNFLKTLKNMVPAMHGITHKYFDFSPLLIASGDLNNHSTVMKPFNELKGIPSRYLAAVLAAVRKRMEFQMDSKVEIYIPPCNKVTTLQSFSIKKAGFKFIYSECRNPFLALPLVRSDFYGRSTDFTKVTSLTTLHITWEFEIFREFGPASIDFLMAQISGNQERVKELLPSRRNWYFNQKTRPSIT